MTGAVALAAVALAPHYVALPSAVTPLSAAPPLGTGAAAAAENVRHRVTARTAVRVSVDRAGAPFAVVATQRLDVRVQGDYFFTIGAPLRDVARAPGSQSEPGLRTSSILWAGFNPGRRVLAARAILDPALAAAALPLRVVVGASGTTLVNATRVTSTTFTGTALRGPLEQTFAQLRHEALRGLAPSPAGAYLTTPPRAVRVAVRAPLLVTGTIGTHRVHALVEDRLTVAGRGAVRLTVTPQLPRRLLADDLARVPDGELVLRVSRALFALARVKQYETYLGNPDPTGSSHTSYLFVTRARPVAAPASAPAGGGRSTVHTLLLAAGVVVAAAAAFVAWARA